MHKLNYGIMTSHLTFNWDRETCGWNIELRRRLTFFGHYDLGFGSNTWRAIIKPKYFNRLSIS